MDDLEEIKITESSGNVFADMGWPDADEAFLKAQLASRIGDVMERRRLTQVKTAKLLGVDQPKVSAITRGHLDGFSVDRLMRFLTALDEDVEIIVKQKESGALHGRLTVVLAS